MKRVLPFIALAIIFGSLSYMGCNEAEEVALVVRGNRAVIDSLKHDNDELSVKIAQDTMKIGMLHKEVKKLEEERLKWRNGYYKLSYKVKVLELERNVGSEVVLQEGRICLTESQMDSVNVIASDLRHTEDKLDVCYMIVDTKQDIIDKQEKKIQNLNIAVDTAVANIDSLEMVNDILNERVNDKREQVKRNRRGWLWTSCVAIVEGVLLWVTN